MIAATNVVDTNVIRVANRQHEGVSPDCVRNCVMALERIKTAARIAIDAHYVIVREYQKEPRKRNGRGPGDAFVKWVLQNKNNVARCDQVVLTTSSERGYENFPDHAQLADFDAPDRVFVAVAAAHPDRPPILEAADARWVRWKPVLQECGVPVKLMCVADIMKFRKAQP
jgi:hypothetical protein